ncbi:antitoxin [Asanoa sp. WMMD1127]|uniref:antitoxin n=1 Tax=Asanoa sp. WMMD1127 TaxID=3016107 RepID=UPI003241C1FF
MDRLKSMAGKHDDKVDKGLDKAGDKLNERTGNKYQDHIDKGVDEAQRRTGGGDTMGGDTMPPADPMR